MENHIHYVQKLPISSFSLTPHLPCLISRSCCCWGLRIVEMGFGGDGEKESFRSAQLSYILNGGGEGWGVLTHGKCIRQESSAGAVSGERETTRSPRKAVRTGPPPLTFLLKELPGSSGSAMVVPVLPAAPPPPRGCQVLLLEPGRPAARPLAFRTTKARGGSAARCLESCCLETPV